MSIDLVFDTNIIENETHASGQRNPWVFSYPFSKFQHLIQVPGNYATENSDLNSHYHWWPAFPGATCPQLTWPQRIWKDVFARELYNILGDDDTEEETFQSVETERKSSKSIGNTGTDDKMLESCVLGTYTGSGLHRIVDSYCFSL